MKKIEFLADVLDKYTLEFHRKGEVKEFDNERANEILNARGKNGEVYAKIIEEIETATVETNIETAVKKTRKKKENDI